MHPFKAPSPDGFQVCFHQGIVRTEVTDSILQKKGFLKGWCDMLISLIPKVDDPESISQFRPISLCNVSYKIVIKMLVNRLKSVFPFIVVENQVSFVPGRHLQDNVVVLWEILHSMRRRKAKKSQMVLTIDLEKAYDQLRWDFIKETLVQVGFPSNWIEVIMEGSQDTSMRLVINRGLSQAFKPSRGVRQGDLI